MKYEEIENGMKVEIPLQKSSGIDYRYFQSRYDTITSPCGTVLRKTKRAIIVEFTTNHGMTAYDFLAEDLVAYVEQETQFVAGTQVEEHPSIPEEVEETEVPFDFSNPPPGVEVLSMGAFLDKIGDGEQTFHFISDDISNDSFAAQDLFPRNKAKGSDFDLDKPQVGLRYNTGKRDYTLMDMSAFDSMIDVLEYGAHKYSTFKHPISNEVYKGSECSPEDVKRNKMLTVTSGRDNWKLGGSNMSLLKLLSSMMRHLVAFMSGQDNDDESKLPHIGHMMCNLMFIGYHWNLHKKNKKAKKGTQFDDRFKS